MKQVVVLAVALLSAVMAEHAQKAPVICSMCACLTSIPFDVDCMNLELHKVPDLTSDNFTFPWIINFAHNLIHEVDKFPKLNNLSSLILKRNEVSKIADGAFEALPDLKRLELQYNNLTGDSLTPEVFKGESNGTFVKPLGLEVLDLSYNHIRTLQRHSFQPLSNLKKLILAKNPLRDISLHTGSAINDLHSLEELDLSQVQINRLPNHFLSDLKNLQVLILAGNNFKQVPQEINYAHKLIHLNLNANPIVSITNEDFQDGTSTLRVLEISAMPFLRNIGRQAFTSLTALEKLSMSDCPMLSIIDNEAFYKMKDGELQLREIHIQDNNLAKLHENLLPWLSIEYVDIQNNPWNCDCKLKWMAETLIPDLERKNPQTTLSILCAEPIADRGMKVVDLLKHAHTFQCSSPSSFSKRNSYGPLMVTTIVVGILMLLTGTVVFAYALFRRTRTRAMFGESIKYRRAYNDEEDTMAHNVPATS